MIEGIQKPNCSTCPEYMNCGEVGEDEIACLSHPNAREYLMAPVIEYLEQYLITETFGGYSETDVAYSKLARETIALIRDGDFEKKDPSDVKGQLIHQSNEWKVYKQDAGMGESDYCVLFKDVFFCRTDDAVIALRIIRAVDERVGYGWQ